MKNLVYGLKKLKEKLYVEDTEDLTTNPQATFVDDRNYAKPYTANSSAVHVKNLLLKNNIETEVIVLRERLG